MTELLGECLAFPGQSGQTFSLNRFTSKWQDPLSGQTFSLNRFTSKWQDPLSGQTFSLIRFTSKWQGPLSGQTFSLNSFTSKWQGPLSGQTLSLNSFTSKWQAPWFCGVGQTFPQTHSLVPHPCVCAFSLPFSQTIVLAGGINLGCFLPPPGANQGECGLEIWVG